MRDLWVMLALWVMRDLRKRDIESIHVRASLGGFGNLRGHSAENWDRHPFMWPQNAWAVGEHIAKNRHFVKKFFAPGQQYCKLLIL
jgi:hypothetical protein